MSADLPPYSGRTATCPKCATSVMIPITTYVKCSNLFHIDEVDLQRVGREAGVAEFLTRRCTVCGFKWFELCADHPA